MPKWLSHPIIAHVQPHGLQGTRRWSPRVPRTFSEWVALRTMRPRDYECRDSHWVQVRAAAEVACVIIQGQPARHLYLLLDTPLSW